LRGTWPRMHILTRQAVDLDATRPSPPSFALGSGFAPYGVFRKHHWVAYVGTPARLPESLRLRHRPRWFRADAVVSCLRRARGP
jgi:hypothetical protein